MGDRFKIVIGGWSPRGGGPFVLLGFALSKNYMEFEEKCLIIKYNSGLQKIAYLDIVGVSNSSMSSFEMFFQKSAYKKLDVKFLELIRNDVFSFTPKGFNVDSIRKEFEKKGVSIH